jgi:hypothetical protein
MGDEIAFSNRVSSEFLTRVVDISHYLGIEPDWLMAAMAFETGGTFSPSIRNAAGSGATGLIQFMPKTAKALRTTTDALAEMSAEDQLEYVYHYFRPYQGRLHTLEDVYMAILWPKGIGAPIDAGVSADEFPTAYRQNCGLDLDKDRIITKREATEKVRRLMVAGLAEARGTIKTT